MNEEIFAKFGKHISRSKIAKYKELGVLFVPGKREGCWIYDLETERKVIDLRSSGGVFNLGHNPDITKKALRKALDNGIDLGDHLLISKQRAEFAQYLSSLLPGDIDHCVFGVSGGEAIDLAIKLARGYTGKSKIISASGGYHGHTGFALTAGDPEFKRPFEPLPPRFEQVPFGDFKAIKNVIDNDTAAILLETIQATAGVIIPSDDYYSNLRNLCDVNDILLIIDEVQTGLGRTGQLWAISHWNVVPDILVLGKGMSGGVYPLSVTCFKPNLQKFFDNHPFIHVSTAGGSDLGCLVAKAMLEETSKPDFLKRVNQRAKQFKNGLDNLQIESGGLITEIRQKGLFIGIQFKNQKLCMQFMSMSLKEGILSLYANNNPSTLIVMPPLIISPEEIDFVLKGFFKALKNIQG